jgi:hypothetical protein
MPRTPAALPHTPFTAPTDDRRTDAELEESEGAAAALDQGIEALQAWIAEGFALERTLRRAVALAHATPHAEAARALLTQYRALPPWPRGLILARTRAQRARDRGAAAASAEALARQACAHPSGLIDTLGD